MSPHTLARPPPSTRQREPSPPKQSNNHSIIVAAVLALALLLSLVGALLLIHYVVTAPRGHNNFTLCHTPACTIYASMLHNTLNASRDPCGDFYRFVCSGWERQQVLSVYRKHIKEFGEQLEDTLRPRQRQVSQQSAADKASHFFQSCFKVDSNRDAELNEFRRMWQDCGLTWPTAAQHADVLTSMVCLFEKTNIPSVIDISSKSRAGKSFIYISTGDVLSILHRRRMRLEAEGQYEDYYRTYGSLVAGERSADLLPFREILLIENVVYKELDSKELLSSERKVIDLKEFALLNPDIPIERWAKLFATKFHLLHDYSIVVKSEENVVAFNRVLKTIGENKLHYYVGWCHLQLAAPYFWLEFSVGTPQLDYGHRMNALFSCYALTEYYMRLATFSNYFQKEFTTLVIADIRGIMDSIAATASEKVANSSQVLDDRPMVASKVSQTLHEMLHLYISTPSMDSYLANMSNMGDGFVSNWVAAADWDRKADRTRLPSIHVNFIQNAKDNVFYAFYNWYTTTWTLPPYVTMLPLYETSVIDVVKFAGLGSLLAVPAVYVLANEYSSFRALSVECFENSEHGEKPDRITFHYAQSLTVAWYAYKSTLQPRSDIRLPLVSAYSHEQLFFIAFCYMMCGQSGGRSKLCNGAVRHNTDFARAFSCSEGSAMTRKHKCTLF